MKYGICVCGLNGCGKTTRAEQLAKELQWKHMDIESYYFTSADNPYASSRTRTEVEQLLLRDIQQNPRFVFSAVNGNMTAEINAYYRTVIYLEAPLEIRMRRIRQRAIEKFGERVLPGGDLYEQEERFFAFAAQRTPENIENWLKTLSCRMIRLDATKSIQENLQMIKTAL